MSLWVIMISQRLSLAQLRRPSSMKRARVSVSQLYKTRTKRLLQTSVSVAPTISSRKRLRRESTLLIHLLRVIFSQQLNS
jgi:hypothetical protein